MPQKKYKLRDSTTNIKARHVQQVGNDQTRCQSDHKAQKHVTVGCNRLEQRHNPIAAGPAEAQVLN